MSFHYQKEEPTRCIKDILLVDKITYIYDRTWKDIIFLPFTPVIKSLFVLLLLITIHINLFVICFDPIIEDGSVTHYVIIVFDLLYACHTCMLLAHKVLKEHRVRRFYKPHSWVSIILDCISILPLQYCNSFVQYFLWVPSYSEMFTFYTTLLKLVRIVRVILKYMEYNSSPGENHKILVTVFHFLLFTITTHIIVIFYYSLSCLECHNANITRFFSYITFDDSSDTNWFIVLYTYVHLVMLHNYWGILANESYLEHILAIISLILGLVLRYIFMMGNMITYYIRDLRYMFWYKQEHAWANHLMGVLQFDKALIEKVNEYYRTMWKEYKGVSMRPEIFYMLPLTLQREVLCDIYWDAMMHTHIWTKYTTSVRRDVASLMTTEIRMPGEVLYMKGLLKSQLIYIVRGVVELMATENSCAPIMSFKSGTVFAPISYIMPTVSNGTFVCRTTCHIHVLNFQNMHKLYRNKPGMYKELLKDVKERISFAKLRQIFVAHSDLGANASHIGWIKKQWKMISILGTAAGKKMLADQEEEETNKECFSSRFLDLMVLTIDERDQYQDIICLRKKCPMLLKADTQFQKFLHYLNLTVIALNFFITAKCIAFDQKISKSLMPILLVLDLFYFLDLYVQLITVPKGFTSHKPFDVLLYHVRQILFILDVIATVPYDYFSSAFNLTEQLAACLRAPRFLKLYKWVTYFQEHEFIVGIGKLYMTKVVKFLALHAIFIGIFVCIYYIYNCYGGKCEKSWLAWSRNMNKLVTGIDNGEDDYVETFHHLISVYLGLKISNKVEINIEELILSTLIATVGFYVSTYCFVQLTAVVSLLQEFTHHFLLNMDILNEITDRKDLLHLKSKIINYANVQWNLNKNQTIKNIYTVMGQESVYLRTIVNKEYVMRAFRNTTLFEGADTRYLKQLAYNSTLLVIPEGHMIFDADYNVFYLYLIVEGNCKYKSLLPCDIDKEVTRVLQKNNCFPVVSVFEELPPLIRVESLTTVILLCVPYLVIRQLLLAFPAEGSIIRKTCEIHRADNEAILRRTPPSSFKKSTTYKGDKVPTFTYSTEISCQKTSFYYGLSKMQQFFKRLVYNTYDPNSTTYIWYEVFRCSCIILVVLFTLLTAITELYQCVIASCEGVLICFWLLAILDMYIRSHVQYYNKLGIKVTKLSKTFKHYVETSFTTDFISTFPYKTLGIVGLFYENKMRSYLVMIIIMRSLALYRPAFLFVYLKNSVNPKYQIYFVVSGAIIIGMYFFATTTHIYLVFTCDTTRDLFEVYEDSWINMYTSLENMKETYLYLIIYYVVSSMTITYTYSTFSFTESIQQLLIVLYIFVMKMMFMTYILGCESHGHIKTAQHQDAIRDYLSFTSKKMISNAVKQEMMDHVGNFWKKSLGETPDKMFENFSPYMKEEIFLSLYKSALTHSFFLHDAEESLYRLMVVNLREFYYKKDADIIRNNDVQDYVYIVANGHVNVYMADLYLSTLRVGGAFGSFNPRGMMRQTVRVTASVHVKIVAIKTIHLYEIGTMYRVLHSRLQNCYLKRLEFTKETITLLKAEEGASLSTEKSRTTKVHNYGNWFFITFYEGTIWVKIWNYLTSVHVVSISSTYCLYVLVVDEDIDLLWLWVLLDVHFLCQIYLRSHTAFTDLDTGVTVSAFDAIALRYIKSLNFYIDVIGSLPLYAISYLLDVNRRSIFLVNKFIRVCNLYTYYHSFVIRKNVPRHLKWTFLIYNTLFLLQFVFDIWYMVADYDDSIKTVQCYLRVFSVYTSAGLFEREFKYEIQLMVNLILIYVTQALLIYMLVVMTRLIIDYNYTVSIFKISLQLLMTYCNNEIISKPLTDKLYSYLTYLYQYHNGRQDPILFLTSPSYILQDHKAAMYGRLIEAHFPFYRAHIDFMRQLFEVVEVGIYLPGDMIVEVGDCNSTMYFIEEGEVIEIQETDGNLSCTIIKAGCFGKKQGLVNVEHTKTYRALTVCSIIAVCRNKWVYLLEYFPATKEVIDQAIAMETQMDDNDVEEEEDKENEARNFLQRSVPDIDSDSII